MSASSLKNRSLQAADAAIGGLVPFSTVDWPGQLAAVLFLSGCPWRCSYCHNPHLHEREPGTQWEEIAEFLSSRRGLLDGVILSGGEPLMDPAIEPLTRHVESLGFHVGLHTAGIYPERLRAILPYLQWVGLDIKTLPRDYDALTGRRNAWAPAHDCLEQLLSWDGEWECRTTWSEQWLSQADLLRLGQYLSDLGVRHYAVQRFRHSPDAPPRDVLLPQTRESLEALFESFVVR